MKKKNSSGVKEIENSKFMNFRMFINFWLTFLNKFQIYFYIYQEKCKTAQTVWQMDNWQFERQ